MGKIFKRESRDPGTTSAKGSAKVTETDATAVGEAV